MGIESWVSLFLNHQTEAEKADEFKRKREIEQQYQIANEAREPAVQAALLKAKADALRDIQTKNNQQDYYNQGFGQWSQLANRGINNAAQLSAMTGGNVDVNSQNQLLQNLAQIQQGIPESSTRLTASQQRFGNDMWGQLNRLGAGERQANAQNAQTQNELDTANYIRSNGLPYLRAQNERIQREGANTLVPVQNALELQQANNELLKQQGYGTDPARLAAIGNAQANRERIHNLTGHWPEDVYKSPILPKFDEQGNVVPQDNSQLYSRALGTELGAQQAAKMDAFMGGNPIDNQVEKAGGVRLMPTVSAGGNVTAPTVNPRPRAPGAAVIDKHEQQQQAKIESATDKATQLAMELGYTPHNVSVPGIGMGVVMRGTPTADEVKAYLVSAYNNIATSRASGSVEAQKKLHKIAKVLEELNPK